MSKDEQTTEPTEPTKPVLYLLRGDPTDDEIEDFLDLLYPDEQSPNRDPKPLSG